MELPTCLGNLRNLKFLSASFNHLKTFPETLCQLNLEVLIMNDNRLKYISPNIKHFKIMKTFHIHNNSVSKLPVSIKHLTKLEEFGLDWFIYHDPESF